MADHLEDVPPSVLSVHLPPRQQRSNVLLGAADHMKKSVAQMRHAATAPSLSMEDLPDQERNVLANFAAMQRAIRSKKRQTDGVSSASNRDATSSRGLEECNEACSNLACVQRCRELHRMLDVTTAMAQSAKGARSPTGTSNGKRDALQPDERCRYEEEVFVAEMRAKCIAEDAIAAVAQERRATQEAVEELRLHRVQLGTDRALVVQLQAREQRLLSELAADTRTGYGEAAHATCASDRALVAQLRRREEHLLHELAEESRRSATELAAASHAKVSAEDCRRELEAAKLSAHIAEVDLTLAKADIASQAEQLQESHSKLAELHQYIRQSKNASNSRNPTNAVKNRS